MVKGRNIVGDMSKKELEDLFTKMLNLYQFVKDTFFQL